MILSVSAAANKSDRMSPNGCSRSSTTADSTSLLSLGGFVRSALAACASEITEVMKFDISSPSGISSS